MTGQTGPLTRPVPVESLPAEGQHVDVRANAAECATLAQLDGLVALRDLVGSFDLRRGHLGAVTVTGRVSATVTQTCTVTLDDFETEVSESVDVTFMPEKGVADWLKRHADLAAKGDALVDDDPPDPIVGGRIDLGALTAEFLALSLDPYPRKPGADYEPPAEVVEDDPSPFAALASLKRDS